jgi:PTH1 family peptidyl-tRNA hydrolase
MSDKYLIVGLGNPGRKYADTRHNIGFSVIDALAERHHLGVFTGERKALTTDGTINGKRVLLAKPQTYMNLSGEAVRALVDYYNIDLERVIVVHDDLDLPLGTLRLRQSGGHGGQNGIRNIIKHLGTKDFSRLRVGIGRPPGRMSAKDYVLQKFSGDDEILAAQVVDAALDALETWLARGIQVAMSQYNGDISDPGTSADPDPKELLHVAERAHEMSPADPEPLKRLIQLYRQLNQPDDLARAHLELGEIYRNEGNLKGMVYEYEQAAKVRPVLIEVREEIARAYENDLDQPKRAAQTWLKLADYHRKQNAMRAALSAVEEALRLRPGSQNAQQLQMALRDEITQ